MQAIREFVSGSRPWVALDRVGAQAPIKHLYWQSLLLLNRGQVTVGMNGLDATFPVSGKLEYRRLRNLDWERPVVHRVIAETRPDDVVFDVGANVGTYSAFLAQRVAAGQGHVVAFEPEPGNATRLTETLERNAPASAWSVERVALGDESGEVSLALASDHEGEGRHALARDTDGATLTVSAARADEFIAAGDLPTPDVLKIDVEGAEGAVIEGFGERLGDVRQVYCEVHPERLADYGSSTQALHGTLEAYGFDLERLQTRRDEYHLRARR